MENHAVSMARAIAGRIKKEADRIDARAAKETIINEQRTLMAELRGLRQAEQIATEFIIT